MMGVSLDTSTTYLEVLGSFLATSPSSFEQQQKKIVSQSELLIWLY